ncbi:MAG: efflux transporter outer membrane subunit [Planctomycetota bacterium]|nr:efflux transporter outer membrane subunit [Planctomycetota bacterium]
MSALSRSSLLAAGLVLAGCTTVGPDYEAPTPALPDAHAFDLGALSESQPAMDEPVDLVAWWRAFDDPLLARLVERALAGNLDLDAALARIAEAEAVLGVERAATGPRADLTAAYTRSGISENTQFGLFPGQERESNDYTAGLGASWELDLWGRNQRLIEAASADFEMRVEDLSAVRVSLVAQVADAYLRLRELQRRGAIAGANITALERSFETAAVRFDAGLVEELDVLRARTELENARALVPSIDRMAAAAVTELELLCGLEPGSLAQELVPAGERPSIPAPSGRLGEQVPADLLRRRPDLRSAERLLAAQTARVGIAEAELYPRLSLAGTLGLQADDPGNLLKATSVTHSIGPSINLPLFSGGGLRANIAAADARVDQALVAYEATLLGALHEVDSAARGIVFEGARLAALDEAQATAEKSLERSGVLYREGLTSIDAVLDARRALFAIEDARAQARSASSRAHVDLYRALGGGWPADLDGTD